VRIGCASERGGDDATGSSCASVCTALDEASASWSCSSLAGVRQRSVAKRQASSALNRPVADTCDAATRQSTRYASRDSTRQLRHSSHMTLQAHTAADWHFVCSSTVEIVPPNVPFATSLHPSALCDVMLSAATFLRVCPTGVTRTPGACKGISWYSHMQSRRTDAWQALTSGMGGETCATDICAGLQRTFGQKLVPSHSQASKPRFPFFGEARRLVSHLCTDMRCRGSAAQWRLQRL
jgi:hypothetical protein